MSPLLRADPWHLEALKRRLDALPHWLDESRCVHLTGLPPLYDIEGQFRLAGLRALLEGLGVREGSAQHGITIWLGWGEPPAEAPRVLLWPAPGAAVPSEAGTLLPLPDPMLALWGLLEHQPAGEGLLNLPDQPDWRELLPLLARIPPVLPVPRRLRRAVLNRALHLVRAHAEVAAPRPTGAILAALVGRAAILSPTAEASWKEWQH